MATLPLADCARMLGIHPKTLNHWLKQADLPFVAHPTDARIKCLTEEHLQQLARLHGRPLQSPPSSAQLDTAFVLSSSQGQAPPSQENEAEHLQTAHSLPSPYIPEADLIQKLSCLETRVSTLQEQLAQLALALLQERERSVERRISALETVIAELGGRPISPPVLPDLQARGSGPEPVCTSQKPQQLNPAEQRARSRMPPLIEYSAHGTYVIISSQEGELHLIPDSVEWFDWLASLSSFRFMSQVGRFTAYRESTRNGPTRGWSAVRCVHGHRYKCYLGVTDRLTISRLEQATAILQSHMTTL